MDPSVKYSETVPYTDNVVAMQPAPYATVGSPQAVTVVTSQPGVTTVINMNQDFRYPRGIPRDWSTGLCGCFEDVGGCLAGFFFGPCYACHVASKMGEPCCTPCCTPSATLVMRAFFRGRHNIQGSILNDCCTICWCGPCAVCQMSRELDNMRDGRAAP